MTVDLVNSVWFGRTSPGARPCRRANRIEMMFGAVNVSALTQRPAPMSAFRSEADMVSRAGHVVF